MTAKPHGPVKMLVVDDSVEFLAAACTWVDRQEAAELVGTARDGAEALAATERLAPDVVLMDVSMPGMDGFAATRAIKKGPRAPLVILISFSNGDVMKRKARAVGADGFLTKSEFASRLPGLLRDLLCQDPPLSSGGSPR